MMHLPPPASALTARLQAAPIMAMGGSLALHLCMGLALLGAMSATPLATLPEQRMVVVSLEFSAHEDTAEPVAAASPEPTADIAPVPPLIPPPPVEQQRSVVPAPAPLPKPQPMREAKAEAPALNPAPASPQVVADTTPVTNAGKPAGASARVPDSAPVFDAAYLRNPAPAYPRAALRRRLEGEVMLDVLVSRQGDALSVEIARSSGYGVLDDAAQRTVRNWRFAPATQAGEQVEARVIVPIEFRMQ